MRTIIHSVSAWPLEFDVSILCLRPESVIELRLDGEVIIRSTAGEYAMFQAQQEESYTQSSGGMHLDNLMPDKKEWPVKVQLWATLPTFTTTVNVGEDSE